MKKWLTIAVFIWMISFFAAVAPGSAALADDDVEITASVSPQTLPGAGSVTLTVTVANSGNAAYPMDNVMIFKGDAQICSVGTIVPADTKTCRSELAVTEEELGREIPLELRWSDNGTARTAGFSVVVSAIDEEPQVEFSRSLPTQVARIGDDVLVTYYVRNIGAIDITNITITDSEVGAIEGKDLLAVGSNLWKTVVSHRMTGAFSSNPTLSYTAGERVYSTTLDAIPVVAARTALEAGLELDKTHVTAGETVSLMCTVTNTGNTSLTSVVVSSDTMGQLFTATNLAPGESLVRVHQITAEETVDYTFNVTGRDSGGTEVTIQTNPVTVTVESVESSIHMDISASCDRQELDKPCDVNFTLTVTNEGDEPLADVQIIDQDGLIIGSMGSLEPGGRQTLVHTVRVESSRVFIFKLSLLMQDGSVREVASDPIEITVAEADPTPEPTGTTVVSDVTPGPDPTASAVPANGGASPMSAELKAILVAIGLIVVAILVLLVLMMRDKERSRAGRYQRRR